MYRTHEAQVELLQQRVAVVWCANVLRRHRPLSAPETMEIADRFFRRCQLEFGFDLAVLHCMSGRLDPVAGAAWADDVIEVALGEPGRPIFPYRRPRPTALVAAPTTSKE